MTGRWLEGALEGIISCGFKGFVHAHFLFLYPKASVSANRGTQPSRTLTCGAAGPMLAFELHLGFKSFGAVFSSSFSIQWLAWRQAGLALDLQPHMATAIYCVPISSGCYLSEAERGSAAKDMKLCWNNNHTQPGNRCPGSYCQHCTVR